MYFAFLPAPLLLLVTLPVDDDAGAARFPVDCDLCFTRSANGVASISESEELEASEESVSVT